MAGPPAFAADVACRQAVRAGSATLALEIPQSEQPLIDRYLASDGKDAARAALLEGKFWRRGMQDGRSSIAMLGLIETSRRLIRSGVPLRLATADGDGLADQAARERAMADVLVRLVREKKGPVVMLVGNLHAHTARGAPWDPSLEFMGAIAKKSVPDVMSLDVQYGAGAYWVCMDPGGCGIRTTKGTDAGKPWTIDVFPAPDSRGLFGTYSVGPAEASKPARGISESTPEAGSR
jgi:hypothetical protein